MKKLEVPININASLLAPAQISVPTQKVHDLAIIPKYESENAAGMDLCYCPEQDFEVPLPDYSVTIYSKTRKTLPTGIKQAIPVGFEGQVRPRSGNAHKKGLTVLNSPGTIDADYRGEIGVILINTSDQDITIVPGDKIAQIVYCPVACATLDEVTELPETVRGSGGFGHTSVVGGN